MDFFENVDPQRRITLRFESLVTHPKSEMERLAEFLHVPYDGALITPYSGSRMTDAATSGAIPIDDPNFLSHSGIDASLAETWRNVSLPYPLADETKELAQRLDYDVAAVTASAQVTPKAKQTSSIAASDRSNDSKDQRRSGRTSRNVSSMDEVFIEANGLRLCVCTWGPADGPVVLCLHGILDQGACWQLVARRLVQRGYRVIAPDFRGHGRSDHIGAGCSYHFLDFVGDADAVLRTLGDQPVSLAGHSLGAIVAAQLALARADRIADLTLVEPPLERSTASNDQRSLTAYLDSTATPPVHKPLADTRAAVDRLRFAIPGMSEKLARDLARRSTEKMAEGLQWRWDARLQARGGLAHAASQFTRDVFCDVISNLTMPVTLVQGTDGMTKLDDRTENAVQRVVACVTVDGGHHLTIEAPDQIAEAIAAVDPSRAESVMLQRCSV
jgi:pimeloyl-ACP methyl ester carboxylesterase